MKKIALLFSLFLIISCEEMPSKEIVIDESSSQISVTQIINEEPEITIQKRIPESKSFKSNFGEIEVNITQVNSELIINSSLKNLENFKHKLEGKIISFIETDVNADGFNEFYCVTDQGNLIAYTSYRNKSFGEIYIPQMPKEFYKNIKDLKSWEVKNNKLLLVFSNSENQVLNTVRYELIKGETGYKLKAS